MVGVELSTKPSDVVKYCCALNRLRDEMRKCNSMINGEFIIPEVEFQSATGRLNTLRTAAIEAGKVIYGDEFTLPELKTERSELAKQADAIDNGGYDMRQYRCLTDHEATYQPVNQAERFAGKYAAMTMESPD